VDLLNKSIDVTIEKAASSAYDARFVMSATTPDRVNDTIDVKAYEPNLGKSLICLWQHDTDKPCGRWDNIRVESGKLIGDLKVASTNLGMMIKRLIADGIPLGASIGFAGRGEKNKAGGTHFKEISLHECSIVSVPAHPRAMQIAKNYGIELSKSLDASVDSDTSSKDPEAIIKKSKSVILAANQTLRK
jgi:HK97 family phage prohead protease